MDRSYRTVRPMNESEDVCLSLAVYIMVEDP